MDTLKFEDKETTEKFCKYCNKPFVWFEKTACNGLFSVKKLVPDCNCIEEREQAQQLKDEENEKKRKLRKLFENSLMTPFFKEKTFEILEKEAQSYGNAEELAQCKMYAETFKRKKQGGILMIGNPGTGKTSILAAVCNHLMKNGYNCLFITLSGLLDKFTKYSFENAGDISNLLKWLIKFDFVVIDDIGRESYTKRRLEIAYRIVDELLNHKIPTAFTANPEMLLSLKQNKDWGATLDRLKDVCQFKFEFHGASQRGRKWEK